MQEDVRPRNQHVVENKDGVILVEARGQGTVERRAQDARDPLRSITFIVDALPEGG